ncbi:MAG TPA: ankyrin repeat domain-containing protein [Opitutales bacterium]|nr:ankyrin repeat domain-containing protein [Opitutales bacterium]
MKNTAFIHAVLWGLLASLVAPPAACAQDSLCPWQELEDYSQQVLDDSLINAIHQGKLDLVQKAICRGANPNTVDTQGNAPLHRAISIAETDIIQLLLRVNARINKADSSGKTPLHFAADTTIAKILLDAGADIHSPNKYGYTPLHSAVATVRMDVLKFFIDKGANVNTADTIVGSSPLDEATSTGFLPEMVRVLIDGHADFSLLTRAQGYRGFGGSAGG